MNFFKFMLFLKGGHYLRVVGGGGGGGGGRGGGGVSRGWIGNEKILLLLPTISRVFLNPIRTGLFFLKQLGVEP